MEEFSFSKLCAVCWVGNKVVSTISNNLTSDPINTCKRYSRMVKAKVNVQQADVIKQCNTPMGHVKQLDTFLNNLTPSIAGKKWYWAQLRNFLHLIQVAAFRVYCRLHPEDNVFQMFFNEFFRGIIHQYIRFQRSSEPVEPDQAHLILLAVKNHFLVPFTQGQCKTCRKNTTKGCKACNVRFHEGCFPEYHL